MKALRKPDRTMRHVIIPQTELQILIERDGDGYRIGKVRSLTIVPNTSAIIAKINMRVVTPNMDIL